jgi:dienelactone hydrolase
MQPSEHAISRCATDERHPTRLSDRRTTAMSTTATITTDRVLAAATPTVSVRPVVIPAPDRGTDLQVRVSAPTSGRGLPVIVFSHGFGQSMDSHDPLVDVWAGHGFVVVQPTHLDSTTLGLTPADPRFGDIWRIRIRDLTRTIDALDLIENAVPGLPGRVDHDRLAVAGHSWGAQSAGMILGARVLAAGGTPGPDETDPRVRAGVLLAAAGLGGGDLTPFAAENLPFMNPSFDAMAVPTLVVAGDHDQSMLSTRGPDWFTDAYAHSPAPKSLLTVFGGEHSLGGIHGYRAADTTDEDPDRVALIGEASSAYLWDVLGLDPTAWTAVRETLAASAGPRGRIDSK